MELRDHQLRALNLLRPGSILVGGVGSGKTITALAYFFNKQCGGVHRSFSRGAETPMTSPKNLLVITTARKRDELDWIVEAAGFGITEDISLSHGGVRIIVDSWNNIAKYEDIGRKPLKNIEYNPEYDWFVVFDEQRLVGKGQWVKSFLKIAKHCEWIILSATPGDVWMDYVPVFVANGFYRNRTDFYEQHVVWNGYAKYPKVDRYIGQAKLFRLRASILVEMPYERHTVRHIWNEVVGYDQDLYDRVVKDRWHVYEERPTRDISELISVARKVVNSDRERLEVIKRLRSKHRRLIVFYNFDYELELLRTLAEGASFELAEWNGHKHEPVPTSEDWVYLVQYAAGAEAWNCITTDAIGFYSANYSYRVFEQAMGRIDRMNTPYRDLHYYRLRSKSSIDAAIHKALIKKKDFNERMFDGAA